MRFGLLTPVVTLNPRVHNEWEEAATVDDVVAIAVAADRLGYHHLTCSEHVAVPVPVAATRGSRYYDPVATLSFLAGLTSRIRLAAHVVVLGYHHPLQIVKRYSTVDVVSHGRLILGAGVGSLAEEFELLDKPFAGRGERADASLRAIRAAWGEREVDGFVLDPIAVQARVPIWIGGRTPRSLRRAVELGDGWAPFGLAVEEVAALLRERAAGWTGDVVLAPEPPFDPSAGAGPIEAAIGRCEAAGATVLNLRLIHRSRVHCVEQLEAFAQIAGIGADG